MSPTRHALSLSDIDLSYLEWNPGGEPVLLLHGLGDHALVWAKLGEDLSDRYHVVAPDLRGHGESSKPESGYRSEEIIADLEGLMDRLGWSSAHVVGHSWTGKLVPIWARQNSARVRSMVLIDPFFIDRIPGWFRITFPLLYRVLPFLKGMGPFESYEDAERQARQLKQYRGWTPLQQAVFRGGVEPKPDGRWGSKFTVAARNGIFEDVMQAAGLTEEIAIPTLFVKPEAGLNRTAWQLQPYYKYLTNLQVRELPGNHWIFLVEPEVCNQAIKGFLDDRSSS